MRGLVYINSRDERSAIRPALGERVSDLVTVNNAEDVLLELKKDEVFDIVILDDSFDERDAYGERKHPGPSVVEILQDIQAGKTTSSGAMIMVTLRASHQENDLGLTHFIPDPTQEDREQMYSELGALLFLRKPYSLSHFSKFLETLVKSAMSPPKWLLGLREMKKFAEKNEFKKALSFFNKFEEAGFPTDHLGLHLTKARCLAATDQIEEAIKVLRILELEFFNSTSIKMNLLELLIEDHKIEEALECQLEILRLQKSISQFERTLELLEKFCEASEDDSEKLVLDFGIQILEILKEDPLPYSKKTRAALLLRISSQLESPKLWLKLCNLVMGEVDILDSTIEILQKGLVRIDSLVKLENEDAIQGSNEIHMAILMVLPTSPPSIEAMADHFLFEKDADGLDSLLNLASRSGADSIEYYVACAKFHLFRRDLKSASDILHKAIQIQADDGRVLAVREQWKAAFEAKNN